MRGARGGPYFLDDYAERERSSQHAHRTSRGRGRENTRATERTTIVRTTHPYATNLSPESSPSSAARTGGISTSIEDRRQGDAKAVARVAPRVSFPIA
jgi:hypothetical protein